MTLKDIERISILLVKTLLVAVTSGLLAACSDSRDSEGWQRAQLIETDDAGDAFRPQIAVDANGYGLAVWAQSDGTLTNIWANRYTPVWGWGKAELIETNDAGDASDPQIAVDTNGNGLAVWSQSGISYHTIFLSNHYTPAGGWEKVEHIEAFELDWYITDSASDPQLILDSTGNGLLVWIHTQWSMYLARHSFLVASRYVPADGWEEPQDIFKNSAWNNCRPMSSLKIALDITSNSLLAVWEEVGDNNYIYGCPTNIWASRNTPAAGWERKDLIETDDVGDASDPQISMDAEGNGLSVWAQSDGNRSNIWANRYTPQGGWGMAGLIETDDAGNAFDPHIAVDADGNGLAVWAQSDGTLSNIWANRYTPHGGWEIAELIEAEDAGSAHNPQIAMNAAGNALAVWEQSGDAHPNRIWANRYTPSGGWEAAELIVADNAGAASTPQIALDGNGNGIVVWQQVDGTRINIWANTFTSN